MESSFTLYDKAYKWMSLTNLGRSGEILSGCLEIIFFLFKKKETFGLNGINVRCIRLAQISPSFSQNIVLFV